MKRFIVIIDIFNNLKLKRHQKRKHHRLGIINKSNIIKSWKELQCESTINTRIDQKYNLGKNKDEKENSKKAESG